MGSEGRAGSGDRVDWVVHAGLFGSPWLVLVAVAALPFPAPWDGAGNVVMAGAALLRSERSVNPPLGPTLPHTCWCTNCLRLPMLLMPFSRTWVQVHPFQCLGDRFAHEPSQSKTKASWGPVPLGPARVRSLGSAGGLDPSPKVFWAALQGSIPVAGLGVAGPAGAITQEDAASQSSGWGPSLKIHAESTGFCREEQPPPSCRKDKLSCPLQRHPQARECERESCQRRGKPHASWERSS